ncbi:MAG: hypothetical protein IJW22_06040 [Clostridia bacterium]|nr:hypothetical protein [Clostridia bacterium]
MMMMTYQNREEFIAALGVSQMPELFAARFEEVMAEYEREGVWFLSEAFLLELQQQYHIFRQKLDFVLKAAERVRKNDFLARYSLLLYYMQLDNDHNGEIYLKEFPHGDESQHADFEMASLFSQIAFAPDMAAYHAAHGVPHEVIEDTFQDCFECPILVCNDCFGRDGSHPRCFAWNQIYMNYRILRVGVLNFEIRQRFTSAVTVFKNRKGELAVLANGRDIAPNGQMAESAGCGEVAFHADITETDEYYEGYASDPRRAVFQKQKTRLPKSEWQIALQEKDTILNVHIPSAVSFRPQDTAAAYARAWELFNTCYPEKAPRAFTCFSWLLDPQLKDFLRPSSNVLAFQSKYHRFAMKSCGTDVYSFLFKKPVERNEDLCEDTSLQRAVKAHYLSGKYIYAQGGVFFAEDLK